MFYLVLRQSFYFNIFNDKIIIMSYAVMDEKEIKENPPKVVFVDDDNKVQRITRYERHGLLKDMR